MITLSKRQSNALKRLAAVPEGIVSSLKSFDFKGIALALLAVFQVLGALLIEMPSLPYGGQELDLSRFTLTWSDEFEAGTFDKTYWSGHYIWGDNATYKRDYAYWNRCMSSFRDGNLIISADYLENGPSEPEGPDGPAYFSYGMDTNPFTDGESKPGFEQLYGYFECRCIFPKGEGLNPAFWLLTDGMWADDTDGGVSGCEIDVFETQYYDSLIYRNSFFPTVHIDSYKEAHRQEVQGFFYADKPTEKYNTYGVEWNKDEYIFYLNGKEISRTDFGGVCTVPLYLIVSLGVSERIENNENLPAEFIIDYVRAYQYNELL